MPLNDWFENGYAVAREEIEATLFRGERPMLIRIDDMLVLLHEGRRRSAEVIPEDYERAKAVCHMPVVIHLLLRESLDVALDEATLDTLGAFRDDLAGEAEGASGLTREMLEACADFVREALDQGRVASAALEGFAEGVAGTMQALIAEATAAYCHALDETVRGWTARWEKAEWSRLLVVICARHAPRYKEVTRQYFRRLLDEPAHEGAKGEERLLYAEGASSERDAMELAATHLLNRRLAGVFLKSPLSLQEDILGDAAKKTLGRMFG